MKDLAKELRGSEQENLEFADLFVKRVEGSWNKAEEVGLLALDRCKEDMTDIFIRLIRAAWKQGDVAGAENYCAKARRRRKIQIGKVDEAYVLLCNS